MRFHAQSEEDRTCFKNYFNKVGEELWPFNQMEAEEGEGFGSAFFGTVDEFNAAIDMLDEEGQSKVTDELFEVGFMDRN